MVIVAVLVVLCMIRQCIRRKLEQSIRLARRLAEKERRQMQRLKGAPKLLRLLLPPSPFSDGGRGHRFAVFHEKKMWRRRRTPYVLYRRRLQHSSRTSTTKH